MDRALHTFSHIAYGMLVVLVVGIGVLLIATKVPLFGSTLQLRIVQSGSMAPAIPTGSLVIVQKVPPYTVGDVITFRTPGSPIPTTHRIVSDEVIGGRIFFTTKGDANDHVDARRVPQGAVEGKVVLAVPYLGYILAFAKTPLGFLVLVVLPALAIVIQELHVIYEAWRECKRGRGKQEREGDVAQSGTIIHSRS